MALSLPALQMIAGFTATGILLALATVIYVSRPRARRNRLLAAFFACAAIMNVSVWGFTPLARDPAVAYAWSTVNFSAWIPAQALYLLILGTLATPLTRPFASRAGVVALAAAAVFVEALRFWRPALWVSDVRLDPAGFWQPTFGPLANAVFLSQIFVHTYGAAASLHAWRRAAAGSVERLTTAAFATAFVWFDVAVIAYSVLFLAPPLPSPWDLYWIWFPAVNVIVFATITAYGILKAQLFDVDLKIKWTIRRGSLAALFVAAFFVVSELASALLSEQVGVVAGVLATGALVFALAPLQRLAERVADTAMPRVRDDDPEYVRLRKADVYRAALEGALVDGAVSQRERDMLTRLQLELGIPNAEARSIEREAAAAAGRPA